MYQRRPTPQQYTIRRVIFLIAVLTVLFIVYRGATAIVDALAARAAAAPSANPTLTVTPSFTKQELNPCLDSNIEVTVSVAGGSSFNVGEAPMVTADIVNRGPTGCLRDVGSHSNEVFVVNAIGKKIWSSDHCPKSDTVRLVEMAPGATYRISTPWPGSKNPKVCGEVAERVPAGTYKVYARNAGTTSKPAAITVR